MEHHPDRGGNTRTMQDINGEYLALLKRLDGYVSTDEVGKEHKYYYNPAREQSVMDKVAELIRLRLPDDVSIWIVGVWIWVRGNTKPVKGKIKSIEGMKWHSKRLCWYWKPYKGKTYFSGASFHSLASAYGATLVDKGSQERERVPELVGA